MSARYSAFSASLVLHLAFGLVLAIWSTQSVRAPRPEPVWIDLVQTKTAPALTKQQIVQTAPGQETKEAAEDAFLGAKTQVVDRQTVSQDRSTQMARAARAQAAPAEQQAKSKQVPTLAKLGVAMLPAQNQIQKRAAREESWADAAKVPQDYVRGIQESDRTALNTKEFIYYGYFQRIRERLDRAWVPMLRKRVANIYKAGRHLASNAEHTTRVVVVLNVAGEITRVIVQNESGTRDLDQAAVDAFNQAGPFPNPPKGIANSQGLIEIPWEFVLRT